MELKTRVGLALSLLMYIAGVQAFVVPAGSGLARSSAARRALAPSGPRMMLPLAPFAGAAIAHIIGSSPINSEHMVVAKNQPMHLVAYKEVREGIYGPYEVEVDPNAKKEEENALSTFKTKEDTEAGRDKYVSVLAVLLAGSFIIPMVQYWWYIRDDDRPIE